ncbi:hypothetical protein B5M42_000400 [Paenibacillus athensensis]|uniref:Butirosin biosynthesis protein H N-terminal domain-containing protein n=1 Tax=Paenibacillus athensensis TaxID=1967502 RepID=A0A4Y8Q8M0_9BACL|nr:hypothetical protein [Paenibacillus athensensis]MCD1257295.1 hypothetical protein [Paenibacillus athensensis]
MSAVVQFAKPHMYTNPLILNCREYHVCEYMQAYGVEHHWLFSDNWGFHYRALDDFSVLADAATTPFWDNLKRLYQTDKLDYRPDELLDVLKPALSRSICLFTFADTYYLPWHDKFETEHGPFHFIITQWDEAGRHVFVRRGLFLEFDGWLPYDQIRTAFESWNSQCFELTKPTLAVDAHVLKSQLQRCLARIVGNPDGGLSGLYGLRQFRDDLADTQLDVLALIDVWWERLREVIDARSRFLEFLHYLHAESKLVSHVEAECVEAFQAAVELWNELRSGAQRQKIVGTAAPAKLLAKLEQVIAAEEQCALQLASFLHKI